MNIAALIPALDPPPALAGLVRALAGTDLRAVVVVNDGSAPSFDGTFEEIGRIPKVHVVRHAVNLGKGAALKTGLNFAYCTFPEIDGVVTADADGQHLPEDILRVAGALAAHPGHLVLGARSFDRDVPFRSLLGNTLTRGLFRVLVGKRIGDTQTGLRGIPRGFIPKLLRVDSNGYEFEFDMLLLSKHGGIPIIEEPIRTVYLEGNRSSHFAPLFDSMKIYFVLFRFALASLATAAIDYAIFLIIFMGIFQAAEKQIAISQVGARIVALFFQYFAMRRAVFYSSKRHTETFPEYVALVAVSGLLSYGLIKLLIATTGISAVIAKPASELLIVLGNFAVMREFIFTGKREAPRRTEWDVYYRKPYRTAAWSRKFTERVLLDAIRRHAPKGPIDVAELGGGNSAFLAAVRREVRPASYHVIDTSEVGLEKLREAVGDDDGVVLHRRDILDPGLDLRVDLAFSVGLIEHFDREGTRAAVEAHFRVLKPGGVAIISFPTPTFLYRITRFLSERLGLWIFHDERPLRAEEVEAAIGDRGTVLFEKTIWPIFLTQRLIVARTTGAPAVPAGR